MASICLILRTRYRPWRQTAKLDWPPSLRAGSLAAIEDELLHLASGPLLLDLNTVLHT